ncbi:DHS-like NAD/FAD-binding domain-containing protein [Entophlyctis helioformis]|nr:DHS-like NAD/FAD-binding domain-containing protein [Entophlyctis helioformis]
MESDRAEQVVPVAKTDAASAARAAGTASAPLPSQSPASALEEDDDNDATPPAVVPEDTSVPSVVPPVASSNGPSAVPKPSPTPSPKPRQQASSSPSTGRQGGRPPPTVRQLLTPLEEKAANPKLNILPNNTIKAFVDYLVRNKCRKVIVMTGAGISTSAGIPDFRSPGTGLYDNLQKYNLPYPEAIFDISYFRRKPQPFYELARELFPGQFKPTPCHDFIRALAEEGMLLRNYTQNIDMLERIAGVPGHLIVEAHGSFHQARCVGGLRGDLPSVFTSSDSETDGGEGGGDGGTAAERERERAVDEGIPGCDKVYSIEEFKTAMEGEAIPRCTDCGGLVKPDIVFFGESLPARFYTLAQTDFRECDALVVMGTSLKVQPFAGLVDLVKPTVPRLLVNRESCGDSRLSTRGFDFVGDVQKYRRDALYLGSCDEGALALCSALGLEVGPASGSGRNGARDEDVDDVADTLLRVAL